MSVMDHVGVISIGTALFLLGCGELKPGEGRKKLHLPDESYVANVSKGEAAYSGTCRACHGVMGSGTQQGPPLVHNTYEPSHHPDIAFHLAVKNGVRQHHWNFGDMPSQTHISPESTADITAYIRSLQREAGID